MTNAVRVNITGFIEASEAFGNIARMSDAASRKAVRAGARPIINQARANLAALPLKDSTGLLKRSIGVKVKKYRSRRASLAGTTGFTHSVKAQRLAALAGTTVAIIGARRSYRQVVRRESRYGREQTAVPANYAHLIEKGAKPHRIGKGSIMRRGMGRGIMHPGFHAMPWLVPALETRRAEAQLIMARIYNEALAQEAIRARAKINAASRRAA